MSEYIMGLGVSVKICKLYEELVYLTFSDNDKTDEFYEVVNKLKDLIDDETDTYDKLDFEDIDRYFDKISHEDFSSFDAVKNRYYSKIKERKDLLDSEIVSNYEFTLDTAIIGKILLDSLVLLEKKFKDMIKEDNDFYYDMYSFHRTYKYTLFSSNDFLEKIAVNNDFDIESIPKIDFNKIKKNFNCSNNFNNYLNRILYFTAKEIIDSFILDNDKLEMIDIYSDLLYMTQLEVIISSMDKDYLKLLIKYFDTINILSSNNSKYIRRLLKK